MKNIKKYPISKLSFIILTDNYTEEEKQKAKEEIQRRFTTNGCNYDLFMEYEERAIKQRGQDINDYLIKDNPNGQLLIELYLKYVYNKEFYEHGNLLFSEILLCNSNSEYSFFTKALKVELENIRYRLKKGKYEDKDLDKINLIYHILDKRSERKNPNVWYETSITDCVMDIVDEPSSLYTDKIKQKVEEISIKIKEGSKLAVIKSLPYSLLENEIIDNLNMKHIANKEYVKLREQRISIANSLCSHNVIDYSFISKKKLIKKKM